MLLEISTNLTRIILISLMILGTIGNVLNLLIFIRPRFSRSSCTLYFIATSINNIIAIYLCVLNRLLLDGFLIDIGSSSIIICKLRAYFGYVILALSPYFFILACFDRYCSSSGSTKLYSWNNKTRAKQCIGGAILLAAILYVHMAIFFQTQSVGSDMICYPQQGLYDSFWRIFYIIIYCSFPSISMSLLCILIANNIHRQLRQINPSLSMTTTTRIHQRFEINLIRILFSHFLIQILCVLPFAIINFLGMFVNRTTIAYTFLLRIFTLPLFASYTVNFYTHTLSSQIYRRELSKIINFCR